MTHTDSQVASVTYIFKADINPLSGDILFIFPTAVRKSASNLSDNWKCNDNMLVHHSHQNVANTCEDRDHRGGCGAEIAPWRTL